MRFKVRARLYRLLCEFGRRRLRPFGRRRSGRLIAIARNAATWRGANRPCSSRFKPPPSWLEGLKEVRAGPKEAKQVGYAAPSAIKPGLEACSGRQNCHPLQCGGGGHLRAAKSFPWNPNTAPVAARQDIAARHTQVELTAASGGWPASIMFVHN